MTSANDLVLPAGPVAAARHPLFIATGSIAAAGTMLMFGMLAVWFKFRDASELRPGSGGKLIHDWLPADLKIPEVATNTLAVTMVIAAIMGQWAVYSAARKDSQHTQLALFITGLVGIAAINAQVAIYKQMGAVLADGAYQTMFYAITGTMLVLICSGVAFSFVAAFRVLGGRVADRAVTTAHALYWYFLTATFVALWFVVYVQK
ncbi:MAG: cytochrome c oxidase subunit 3 [Actinomycetota bacterium]